MELIKFGGALSRPSETVQVSATTAATVENQTVLPALRGEEAVKHLKVRGQYASLAEAMQAARYRISPVERTPLAGVERAYHAPNPAQGLNAWFGPEQVHLTPKPDQQNKAAWQMALSLTAYGYGHRLVKLAPGEMTANENRIEIQRPTAGQAAIPESQPAITEWYVNEADGLQQGFTLAAPPAVERNGERLRLTMRLTGDLRARVEDDGQAVSLVNARGEQVLSYGGLVVNDAEGRELEAQLAVDGSEVAIEVNDADAVYPVVIDPTFVRQAKLTAGDSAVNDQFGESVAISGETAIVWARLDTVGLHQARGSAHIFVPCPIIAISPATLPRNYTVVINCVFTITPTSQSFPTNGGNGTINVTTASVCTWTSVSNNAFIRINGKLPLVGITGSGGLSYTVDENPGNASRTGTITIAGQIFTVTQAGPSASAQSQRPVAIRNRPAVMGRRAMAPDNEMWSRCAPRWSIYLLQAWRRSSLNREAPRTLSLSA